MNRMSRIGLLVVGVVLLIYGSDSTMSFASSVSKFFSGAPTNKSILLLVVGSVLTVSAVASLFDGGHD